MPLGNDLPIREKFVNPICLISRSLSSSDAIAIQLFLDSVPYIPIKAWDYHIKEAVGFFYKRDSSEFVEDYLKILRDLVSGSVSKHSFRSTPSELLRIASVFGHLQIVRNIKKAYSLKLIQEDFDFSFRWACANGHLFVVEYLMKSENVDIHSRNDQALQFAVLNGHLSVVRYLINNGADPNSRDGFYLTQALQLKHHDVFEFLSLSCQQG